MKYNEALEQGRNGGTLLTSTSGGTTSVSGGDFGGLLILEDTVIDTITAGNVAITNLADILDDVTLAAGLYIPMQFTAIAITSGTVIAYNAY